MVIEQFISYIPLSLKKTKQETEEQKHTLFFYDFALSHSSLCR